MLPRHAVVMRQAIVVLGGLLTSGGLLFWIGRPPAGPGAAALGRERATARELGPLPGATLADGVGTPSTPSTPGRSRRGALAVERDSAEGAWSGPDGRRAASGRALAVLAGWTADDPRGLELADWLAARPDPSPALASRTRAALVQHNLDAAAWRQRLVALAGHAVALRMAPTLEFAALDVESSELVRVDLSGQPLESSLIPLED